MLSSGFSHSGSRDLYNGVTVYSSITGFEYANLLMLVTVIPLPSLMPSWGSHWAICWQQGFSCWFLILSCGWRGNPLDQPPEIEGAWKVKREGCEIEEKGIFFFLQDFECLFPCYLPRRSSHSCCWWDTGWVRLLHPTHCSRVVSLQ